MKQYFTSTPTADVEYYRVENGGFYIVYRMTKLSHTSSVHPIYTFDDMLKCIRDPDNVIRFGVFPMDNENMISRFYSKNWFVEINTNQLKITM